MLREFPLPPRAADRLDADGRPVHAVPPVREAATVLLVRDGVQVFAFRRVPRMVFAPGMLVFPGGSVDPGDADAAVPFAGPPPPGLAALVAAAVRETFEECGVLLARDAAGGAPDAEALASPVWEDRRTALASGRASLGAVLAEAGLAVDTTALIPWAHWVTPEFESRRFDTRFFLARVPEGQEPRDLGGEGERAGWLDARDAVARFHRGELPMLPPTLVCLEELAAAESAEALLRSRRRVRRVEPWAVRGGDGHLVLRAELDMPEEEA